MTLQRHTTLQSLALVYGLIASFAVVLFLGWARTATSFESPSTEHASSLWEYGRFNLFSNVSAVGYEWIDVTYIGVLIGPAAVGVYEMAWRITSILLLFTNSFADTIIPQVSKWHSTGAVERIQSFVTTGIIVALLVPLPGFLGIVLLSNPLLGTIFGEQYTAASMALVILAGGRCIESINKVVGRTLHGLDYPRIGAEISVVILVLNVVMNSVLVWRFGISGAAIGTVLSFSVGAGIAIYKLNHIIEFDFPWRFAVSLVIPLSIMALLIKVLQLYIDTSSLIGLVSLVAAGAVVYTLSLMAIPGPRLSLKQSLKTLQ